MRDPDRNFIELRGRKLGVIEGVTRYVPWACGVDPSPSSMHRVLPPCARVSQMFSAISGASSR